MASPDPGERPDPPAAAAAVAPPRETLAASFGLNRATLAILVAIGGMGLAEEFWLSLFGPYLKSLTKNLTSAVLLLGVFSCARNLLEGVAYIVGGSAAHRLGPRAAILISAAPMVLGFGLLLATTEPWVVVVGALLMGNWEPLSVPTAFEIVGSTVPKNRRTIAFAMKSIQKRLPKIIGPLTGGAVFALGYWVNLTLAICVLAVTLVLQWTLLNRMKPTEEPKRVPWREVLRGMSPDLRALLTAEIFLRWGDWIVRDMASLYVVGILLRSEAEWGLLLAITSFAALLTFVPVGKLVDAAPSAKPYIGLTFFLFAIFPINLVLLPKVPFVAGDPQASVFIGLCIAFVLNGLREMGEPARKALIASSFPKDRRARAVGLYWGLRSFAFCPSPIVAALLWMWIGPEYTFLLGGALGLIGTAWFWLRVRCQPAA